MIAAHPDESEAVQSAVFPYRKFPLRGAVGAALLLVCLAALLPWTAMRILLLVSASGPLLWIALQIFRRSRTVQIRGSQLFMAAGWLGRQVRIPCSAVRAVSVTERGGVAIVYVYRDQGSDQNPGTGLPPTRSRSGERGHGRPQLAITPSLVSPAQLVTALTPYLSAQQADTTLIQHLSVRRRRLFWVAVATVILLIPLYIFVWARFQAAFSVNRGNPFDYVTPNPHPLFGVVTATAPDRR